MEAIENQKKGISGSTLKLIAITTMFIDHVGAGVLGRYLRMYGLIDIMASGDMSGMLAWMQEHGALYWVYYAMRMIGRIAFPIFVFLMVEGFQRTHNKWKYALRMGIFALVSEIPFDLTFNAKVLEFTYQNVFFTLLVGLLVMIAMDAIGKTGWNKVGRVLLSILAFLAGAFVAQAVLHTDYGAMGIVCITAVYLFRKNKVHQIIAGCIAFAWEIWAPLAFIPIGFYNGKRGLKLKYVFYAFYPAHLLLIYLICLLLGINGYASA